MVAKTIASKRNSGKRLSPARKDPMYRRFAREVGHKELLAVLECSDDVRGHALANLLCDPAYNRHSLAKLCELVGLRYLELPKMFHRFYTGIGIIRFSRYIPQVMEDTARDALSTTKACERCDGTGERDGKVCSHCQGKGTIHVPADPACRKLIWESTGLIGRRRLRSP